LAIVRSVIFCLHGTSAPLEHVSIAVNKASDAVQLSPKNVEHHRANCKHSSALTSVWPRGRLLVGLSVGPVGHASLATDPASGERQPAAYRGLRRPGIDSTARMKNCRRTDASSRSLDPRITRSQGRTGGPKMPSGGP